MAFPPPVLPTDKANATPNTDDHPAHHNDMAAAINDVVVRVKDEVVNVKDSTYGAVGNGTTNDRVAIQTAINTAATASRGGTVFFPPGDYAIDCTTEGLSLPNDKGYKLLGAGHVGGGAAVAPTSTTTLIKRSAGTNPLISNPLGASSANRWRAAIENIEFRGGSFDGRICYIRRTNHCAFIGVRFSGPPTVVAQTNPSVEITGHWNSHFERCIFQYCGYNVNVPAVKLPTDGDVGGESITVHFTDCEWEVNHGVDLWIQDYAIGINLVNCKMESYAATTRTWPLLRLENVKTSNFVACYFGLGGPAPLVYQPTALAERNSFVGCSFDNSGGGTGSRPLIDQQAGYLAVTGCVFSNLPANVSTAWNIGASVPGGAVTGGALGAGNLYKDTTKRYIDARGGGAGPINIP